jgi:uncharacterized repeat protein (TIGR01451 family)
VLRHTKRNACHKTTFVLSTLAASIFLVQHSFAKPITPQVGVTISNTASATYISSTGKSENSTSNTVQVNVMALYAISLSTPPIQEIEIGTQVVWSNTLTNLSNTQAQVNISHLNLTGLSNIKVYIDTNKNGQFDAADLLLTDSITLQPQESVNLWVVADTSSTLPDKQQLNLPITATVVEDDSISSSATDALTTYLPQLYATKTVDQTNFTPAASGQNYDLTYSLAIDNRSNQPVKPTSILIDGLPQSVTLVVDPLPANTIFKTAQPVNSSAIVLFRTGANSYTRQVPADKKLINELLVAYPQSIAGHSIERVQLVVTMNPNIADTTIVNRFQVQHTSAGLLVNTPSNDAVTIVGGTADISNYSGDYSKTLATGTLNKPLHLSADTTLCNASRTVSDKVQIRVQSTKTGDVVVVVGVETGPNSGVFRYDLPTEENTVANPNDQILQTVARDTVLVSLVSCLDEAGQPTTAIKGVETTIYIDPYGIVFDAKTGLPVAGATVILLDASGNPIGDNVAFNIDPVTSALQSIPAKQITDAKGQFVYPDVIAGTYSISVDTSTIVGQKYTYVSDQKVYPISGFSSDKIINPLWSYGGQFTLHQGDVALNVDIPIDPTEVAQTSTLFVQKTVTNPTAELGDFEDYTVTVANRGHATASDVSIKDTLPRGFTYVLGTTRVNGIKVNDPLGGKGPYLKLGIGSLDVDKVTTIKYRVQIGPNALNGDGINRVRAKDISGIESNEASALVKVTPGALIQDAFVVGKVYMDCNRNGMQDDGEQGVPGVRLYLEDGSFVVTDREGKYDFYGVSAKTHVLKLDQTTIPINAELILQSNRMAGDPSSRFVDLKHGELHRADFAIADGSGQCTQPLIDQVVKRKKRIAEDNLDLERAVHTDLSIEPLASAIGNTRGQPASGCIGAQSLTANCNIEFSADQLKSLKVIQVEPIKPPTTIDLERALEQAESNKLTILNLKDGQVMPFAQTNIQVRGVAGTVIQVLVNGQIVPEERIGKKAVLTDFQIEGFDYIGVALKTGRNEIEVRQIDTLGNLRDQQKVTVIAPDQMSKITLNAPSQVVQANGVDVYQVVLKVVDQNGVMVASRTPVTLKTTIGKIDLIDLDPKQSGTQIFIEGGTVVVPIIAPSEAGQGTLLVSSGVFNATQPLRFLPNLRPMIAVGIIEGSLSLKNFDPKQLGQTTSNDGFENELKEISSSNKGQTTTNGRAALFLKGKVRGDYLLTMSYDSDKNGTQRLFRDIQPDEYYPVYGDAAAKGFDAQSTSKLYVRVDKGRSYAMYGDYVTRTENDEGLSLGQYSRSLTGLRAAYENDHAKATGFVARTNATQIVSEQRGLGITGPYSMGQVSVDDVLTNSEKVEVIVRDRNNPGLIVSQTTLDRFTDYEVDTTGNSIYLKSPISSVDSNLNPVYLRITLEADQGGSEYIVGGVSGSVKVLDQVRVGGSLIKSDDPITHDELSSVNTVIHITPKAKLIAEYARSSNTIDPNNSLTPINAGAAATGEQSGNAARVEFETAIKNIDLRAYYNHADLGFYNTASPITAGRTESGVKAQSRVQGLGLIHLEAIRTEDLTTNGLTEGVSASLERSLNRILKLELGLRYYNQQVPTIQGISSIPTTPLAPTPLQLTPYDGITVRAKLTAILPWEGSNVYSEFEQDVMNSDRHVLSVGGNYQINSTARVYARQEVISSIGGLYDLNDTQRRNTTVFGVENKYSQNGSVFSEYRVADDGLSAREAEAAMGLRNRWKIKDGVFINTSFEKVTSINGTSNLQTPNATAASLGIEYLADPKWKAVARVEKRWSDQSDTLLSTLGWAYKLTDDVTVLTKNIYSQTDNKSATAGEKVMNRFQLGAAYRDFAHNRFDALSKIEYRYQNDQTDLTSPNEKRVYIFSNDVNYHPIRRLTFSGQYAAKYVTAGFDNITSRGVTQMLAGRAMYDINERWDAGVNTGVLWNNATNGKLWLVGGEVGYLLAVNLWGSAGYNFSGYRDTDLVGSNTTTQGPYVRLRFKFDETLFKSHDTRVNSSLEPLDAKSE